MDNNITQRLAEMISGVYTNNKNTLENTKKLIVDYMSASYAGYQYNRKFNQAVEEILLPISGGEEASVFNSDKKLPVAIAAFLNATYAHGADIDDGHRRAMGHIGASVISAVFALADSLSVSEEKVLLAIIVGYEVYVRLSSCVQPGMVKRGFHSTGTAGAIACGAACAKLLDLNEREIESAISMSATQSSGLLIVGETGQLVKPLSPARAAETGVFSALLAKKGIEGPQNSLESKKGWFHTMSEHFDIDILFRDFEMLNAVNECYVKPYPSCRHTHCGIEAASRLHEKVVYNDIEKIEIYIYENAINLAGVISFPKNMDEAKFSIQYTLACAIYYGEFKLEYLFPDAVDKEVYNIIPKIELICDNDMESSEKGIRGARVVIISKGNKKYEETVLRPKGEPETPFLWEDIYMKLQQCASDMIGNEEQKKLIKKIMNLGGKKEFSYRELFYS
ncbi:MAG: MmgE/PrpD family protein [Lachnospiraceae bacterium]|nr:MmgE/PrpD family protein [Lachnospiraceae bacterium]